MKAPAFDYVRPDSLDAALALLRRHGGDAQVLAGGQSLMPMLNLRMASPSVLVDIGGLPGLRAIEPTSAGLRIGALVTHTQLLESARVADDLPLLAQAVPHVAHVAIRNAGTIGGSLALADPAAEYPAVALALEATLVLAGAGGERRVPAAAFFRGLYETARAADEILVAVEFPARSPSQRFAFLELSRRRGDYAMVGLAASLTLSAAAAGGGSLAETAGAPQVEAARLAWFALGDRPLTASAAQAALVGRPLDAAAMQDTARGLSADLDGALAPMAGLDCDVATKRHLAGVLLGRALKRIAEAA